MLPEDTTSADMHLKRVSRDGDGLDSPSLAVVAGDEITSDALTLAESVDVVGVRDIKDDFSVDPGCLKSCIRLVFPCIFCKLKRENEHLL